jgi:hypothetical protein
MHPGVGAPVFSNIGKKMLFENLKKNKIIFFMNIFCWYLLSYLCKFSHKNTLVCSLHEMTKYLNGTIMIGCVLFTVIGNPIFTFMCRIGHTWFFYAKICTNKYQQWIYMCAFSLKKIWNFKITFFLEFFIIGCTRTWVHILRVHS